MRRLRDIAFRLRVLLAPGRMERELEEELHFHLEMEAEKLVREGLDPTEARRQARARFGSPRRQRDQVRWSWGISLARDIVADARLVGRQLRRNPAFAFGAIVTLALGIGANTAIFSIADQALFNAPPVEEPNRLVAVYTTCRRGQLRCSSSYPDYLDYRASSSQLTDLAAYSTVPLNVSFEQDARLATGVLISGNYFGLLGLRPGLGRYILPVDDRPGAAAHVAVLNHDLWRSAFGGDEAVVGRSIRLNGTPYEIIGVAPAGFRGLSLATEAGVWIPLNAAQALGPGVGAASEPDIASRRGVRWISTLVGRLAPSATHAGLRAEMDALALRLGDAYPEERAAIGGPRGITVSPIDGYILPVGNEDSLPRFIWLLLAVVGLSLLLAAANLANLLLARATARGREIGIRIAVGAGRRRVIRQLLTESLVLALLGGAAGIAVARAMLSALGSFDLPGGVSIASLGIGLDPAVLLFALTLSLVTAVLFGLLPALEATRGDIANAVKGTIGARLGRTSLRKGLVAVQIGLCLVLLMGSGLFIRTLRNSLEAELGFDPDGLASARFNLSLLRYTEEEGRLFVDQLLAGTRELPGVRAASVASLVPFQLGGFRGTFVEIDGYEPAADEEIRVDFVLAEPGYFAALGSRLVEGRGLPARVGDGADPVVVINRHMAERYWAGRPVVGSNIRFVGMDVDLEVVGVVEDPSWQAVGEDATPFVFLSLAETSDISTSFLTLLVRTDGDATALLPAIRERFRALDPALSLTFLRTMEEQVGNALMPQRMGTTLLSMFGLLALVMAAVGVYGVVSYSVQRQTRDIGIRIAIGASASRVLRGVVREMIVPVGVGLLTGTFAALALARSVESFMFGVSPTDPLTFAAITGLLLVVALSATLVPARRASRLDPVEVLRSE